MEISVYIIAFNEAEKIRDCISSVLWADEIIVADSNSTDGTTEIAESLGAKVFHIPFEGYGKLRNKAISYCTNTIATKLFKKITCNNKRSVIIDMFVFNRPSCCVP